MTRRDLVFLALICLFGLVRGLYGVTTSGVFSIIDEGPHIGYVQSLAEGDGIPVVGRDRLSDDITTVEKESPTRFWRSLPVSGHNEESKWGASGAQYEGMQGPPYYALMVPAFWAGDRVVGFLGAVYAVRLATMLLALTAIPITWLLARELFPGRSRLALVAAGFVAVLNGPLATASSATNDALALPLGALCALVALRAFRRPTLLLLALAGAIVGIALVAKSTAVTLVPALALLFAYGCYRHRARGGRQLICGVAVLAVAAAAPVVPWLAWNLANYDSLTAADEVDRLLGEYQTVASDGFGGVIDVVDGLRHGLWNLQALQPGSGYQRYWEIVVIAAALAGLVYAFGRRSWGARRRVAWAVFAMPLGSLAIAALAFGAFGGVLSAPGRYLFPVLPLTAVAVAAGVEAIGGVRFGLVVALALATGGFVFERTFDRNYIAALYEQDLFDGTAPVLEQSWGDGFVPAAQVEADAQCPSALVALRVEPRPPTLKVRSGAANESTARWVGDGIGFNYYRVDQELAPPLRIDVPSGSMVVVSEREREPAGRVVNGSGDPLVRVYCNVEDPGAVRFDQLFPPLHPRLPRWLVLGWLDARIALGVVALVAAAVAAARRPPHRYSRRLAEE